MDRDTPQEHVQREEIFVAEEDVCRFSDKDGFYLSVIVGPPDEKRRLREEMWLRSHGEIDLK
jgi:hypothetical protein